jgi:hypothetical protein
MRGHGPANRRQTIPRTPFPMRHGYFDDGFGTQGKPTRIPVPAAAA